MKTITDITRQVKDKKRVNLYIDGQFFSGVEEITLLTNNLHIGDLVDEKKLEEIVLESEYTSCFAKATNYILKGSHTKAQVAGYLSQKGFDGKIIHKVIVKLEEYGYLDDLSFAKTFVETKSSKYGKHYIRAQLKYKGVPEDIIEEALNCLNGEFESAYQVGKKYLKGRLLDIQVKQKVFRYILSKGFSYDVASEVLNKLEREQEV